VVAHDTDWRPNSTETATLVDFEPWLAAVKDPSPANGRAKLKSLLSVAEPDTSGVRRRLIRNVLF
jgi:hypothetical protein